MNSGTILGYFLQTVPIAVVVGTVYTILRLVFLKRRKCPVVWFSEAMRLMFVFYLTGLCSLLILPANFWLHIYDGIFFGLWEYMGAFFRFGEVNLIPTIVKCLSGEFILDSWVKEMLVGNVVMFMPFGFFLPFVTEKLNKKRALTIAVIVPVVVEFFQLIIGRSFDIDDLICNFFGIVVGCLIANGIKRHGGCFKVNINNSRLSG
ncbi:MAG: VanZ family protein [Oscillospiraceae bacterium]